MFKKKQRTRHFDEEDAIPYSCHFNKMLYPYLLHFGNRNITPEVLEVAFDSSYKGGYVGENDIIAGVYLLCIKKIKGPILGEWLACNWEYLEKLQKMYQELGYKVGYIHKYGVYHGHLKTDNVVVNENGSPILIDWKWGRLSNSIGENERGSPFGDTGLLLPTARESLERAIKAEDIAGLERIYRERRLQELSSPLEVSIEELKKKAIDFIYVR